MGLTLALTALTLVRETVVATSNQYMELLGWTQKGQLLYSREGRIHQWPSGRSVKTNVSESSYPAGWLREPGRDRWASVKGIVDGSSLRFIAHRLPYSEDDSRSLTLFWRKGQVGVLTAKSQENLTRASVCYGGRETALPSEWVDGFDISSDGKYLTACKTRLDLDEADLYFLRWQGHGKSPAVVQRLPRFVLDHYAPTRPEWNRTAKAFLINLATGHTPYPYLVRSKGSRVADYGRAEWLNDGSAKFLLWSPGPIGGVSSGKGFPSLNDYETRIDLCDATTSMRLPLASEHFRSRLDSGDETPVTLVGSRWLLDGKLDKSRARLAMLITKDYTTYHVVVKKL